MAIRISTHQQACIVIMKTGQVMKDGMRNSCEAAGKELPHLPC